MSNSAGSSMRAWTSSLATSEFSTTAVRILWTSAGDWMARAVMISPRLTSLGFTLRKRRQSSGPTWIRYGSCRMSSALLSTVCVVCGSSSDRPWCDTSSATPLFISWASIGNMTALATTSGFSSSSYSTWADPAAIIPSMENMAGMSMSQ